MGEASRLARVRFPLVAIWQMRRVRPLESGHAPEKARSLYPGMRLAAATAIGELGQQGAAEQSSPSAGMTRRFAVNPRQGAIRLAANDADAAEGDKPPTRRALCLDQRLRECTDSQSLRTHSDTDAPYPETTLPHTVAAACGAACRFAKTRFPLCGIQGLTHARSSRRLRACLPLCRPVCKHRTSRIAFLL